MKQVSLMIRGSRSEADPASENKRPSFCALLDSKFRFNTGLPYSLDHLVDQRGALIERLVVNIAAGVDRPAPGCDGGT